ncbi:hypothetical protein [Curtobacterium sp. Curtsp57]|uniref:hypothetical protein n=1 Tax=Curtobacterium sp. Curtsp57 TaxID=3243047 RepID=UPI0039B50CF4
MTSTMLRSRSAVAVLAGLLLLPALLTACSSTPDTGSAPRAGDSGNSGAVELASCMRDKGYDMEDPSSSGGLQLSPPDGVDADQWRSDLVACTGDGKAPGEANVAKPMPGMEDMARAMAECMRDNGFSDYPDDQGDQASYTPSGDASTFADVEQTCGEKAYASMQKPSN